MRSKLGGLYADRMALYRRFMNRELDRKNYMAQLAAFDAQIDRLELTVLRSCGIYRKVCAVEDPTSKSNSNLPDRS